MVWINNCYLAFRYVPSRLNFFYLLAKSQRALLVWREVKEQKARTCGFSLENSKAVSLGLLRPDARCDRRTVSLNGVYQRLYSMKEVLKRYKQLVEWKKSEQFFALQFILSFNPKHLPTLRSLNHFCFSLKKMLSLKKKRLFLFQHWQEQHWFISEVDMIQNRTDSV